MQGASQRRRAALPSVVALVLLVLLIAAPAVGAAPRVGTHVQELALLQQTHTVWSAPDKYSKMLGVVRAQRPLTDEQTALPVVGHAAGSDGVRWLQVLLPGRPNGHTGWIVARDTTHATTPWRILIRTAARLVTIYRGDVAVRTFPAVVGKPSTPTPHGTFFVEEAIQLRSGDVGAPFALALSARSTVFQEFDGGPGQVALHGLTNVGGVLGTAVSHGCVRLANDAMRWLVVRVGPGVPVTITS